MKRLWAIPILMLLAAAGNPARSVTPEVQVKAAYLFKLASFVRWPEAAASGDPFTICISGRADIAGALTTLVRDQSIGGKRVVVQQLAPEQAHEAQDCQMLFVGRGAQSSRAMLKGAEGGAVLTVTDRVGGTRGGVIEFMVENGKVRLAIDRRLATAHRLELSSKLMDVAAEVKQ